MSVTARSDLPRPVFITPLVQLASGRKQLAEGVGSHQWDSRTGVRQPGKIKRQKQKKKLTCLLVTVAQLQGWARPRPRQQCLSSNDIQYVAWGVMGPRPWA